MVRPAAIACRKLVPLPQRLAGAIELELLHLRVLRGTAAAVSSIDTTASLVPRDQRLHPDPAVHAQALISVGVTGEVARPGSTRAGDAVVSMLLTRRRLPRRTRR